MQQDNIKDFAIAAFRYRGHLNGVNFKYCVNLHYGVE